MSEIRLSDSDRTIFAVCKSCNSGGKGKPAPNYFSMAYTKYQWRKTPTCDNCGTKMEMIYEVDKS